MFSYPYWVQKDISNLQRGGVENTSENRIFKSKVHSMYKKGKIREERMNREDIVEVSQVTIEELK